jgi:hypothetical protein
MVSNSNDLA